MSFFDKIKNLFGFTPAHPEPPLRASEVTPPKQEAVKRSHSGLPPAAELRDELLRFLIVKLRTFQNEPTNAPAKVKLYIRCADPEDQTLFNVALWNNQPGRFQKELQRQLADNYITLAENWEFDWAIHPDELPETTFREGNLGLLVLDNSRAEGPVRKARVAALTGQTEHEEYRLDPVHKTSWCIGRGHTTQTATGRVRTNDIVFLNEGDTGFSPEKGEGNGAVSRAHASIQYNAARNRYALLVDPGGLPSSGNKTKIIHPDDHIERADIPGMAYPLEDGDQIELGGEVVLLFELTV